MEKSHRWSYSSLKLFEQCPRKYYHLRVVRDYAEPESEAMTYGTRFHEAAEFYVRSGTPLPQCFDFAKAALDKLRDMPGRKLCEYEMGVREDLSPCEFNDPDVWFRGIADLLIINDDAGEARVVDYKTGKSSRYADPDQLELMSLCVFKHFPHIKRVRSGLLFVIANDFVTSSCSADQGTVLWEKWVSKHGQLKIALQSDVWNPKPSGLCKRHCVVECCPHNGRN